MRIAILTGGFPVLSETFVIDHIIGLAARGHDVEVYPSEILTDQGVDDERCIAARRYLRSASLEDLRPPARALRVARVWLKSAPADRRRLQATVREELRTDARIPLRLASRALPFLPRRPFDIVHCHFGDTGQRAVQLARLGVIDGPVITSFHGYDVSSLPLLSGPTLYDELFARGQAFIAVSGHVRRRLLELKAPPLRTHTIRLGIDLSTLNFTDFPATEESPVRIVSVGRLVDKKGHDTTIRAVVRLKAQGHSVQLKIIGEGPKRGELEALIENLGCGGFVELVGAASRSTVQDMLGHSHLFVMASRTAADGDQEGLPVALMEAMARGLPIVATRHGAIPELVEDGVSGLLVDENDAGAMAGMIGRLVNSAAERGAMGRRAREAVAREHDAVRQIEQLELLYQSAAADFERSGRRVTGS